MAWTRFSILNRVLGKPIRSVPSPHAVFITFDDGPDPELTPRVLDLLKEYGVKATFFVVVQKAEKYPALLKRIQIEGHALGNHSLDHTYSTFFKGYKKVFDWVRQSEILLKNLGVEKSVGFRPPVGIRTPELAKALETLHIPLILWKQRSFDRAIKFTEQRARSLAKRTHAGDIVLLHDVQRREWQQDFLVGLKTLIEELSKKGLFLPKLELSEAPKNNVLRLLE